MVGKKEIAGIVLAGGRSRRMGTDKTYVTLGGRILLDHMIDSLKSAGICDIYISASDQIADIYPGHGPLSGIHAVLARLCDRYQSLLFVPVDMPSLKASSLRKLMAVRETAPLACFAHYPLPFILKASTEALSVSQAILARNENVSLRYFQSFFKTLSLNADCDGLSINVNTPEDLENLGGIHEFKN